jgi:hypothetical protein
MMASKRAKLVLAGLLAICGIIAALRIDTSEKPLPMVKNPSGVDFGSASFETRAAIVGAVRFAEVDEWSREFHETRAIRRAQSFGLPAIEPCLPLLLAQKDGGVPNGSTRIGAIIIRGIVERVAESANPQVGFWRASGSFDETVPFRRRKEIVMDWLRIFRPEMSEAERFATVDEWAQSGFYKIECYPYAFPIRILDTTGDTGP